MKNNCLILTTALISLAAITIPSCKRGANDPFLSMRSRDARITGKWKLTGMNHKQVNTSISGSTVTITETTTTYANSVQTIKTTGGSPSS